MSVIHHHIKEILQETKLPIKFSYKGFIGLPYSKIVLKKLCDQCKRMGSISTRHEMPLQGLLVVQLFDVWGIDFI